jgi:hypothetical protein
MWLKSQSHLKEQDRDLACFKKKRGSSNSTVALLPSGQAETESSGPAFEAGSLSVVGPVGTSPTEAQFISQTPSIEANSDSY